MTVEGEIGVRLAWDGHHVQRVDVRSMRPFAAPRVLVTRAPDAAAALVPLLYSVCAHAQGAAAAGAINAALGADVDPATTAAREHAVVLETLQEYFWRVLIDWPSAMGAPAQVEPVGAARKAIAPVLATLAPLARRIGGPALQSVALPASLAPLLCGIAQAHIYGSDPAAWLANLDADALVVWARDGATQPAQLLHALFTHEAELGRSDVAPMPAAEPRSLADHVVSPLRLRAEFARTPHWDGAPVETGALARLQDQRVIAALRSRLGNAVPVRMTARLVELAMLLARIDRTSEVVAQAHWLDTFAPADGGGVAAVQTARGLLLHYTSVVDGRIADYRIVAPTEWNFHPQGALACGLLHMAQDNETELVRQTRISVQALDPCVACLVEVRRA